MTTTRSVRAQTTAPRLKTQPLAPLYPKPRRGWQNLQGLAVAAVVFLVLIAAPAALCYLYSVLPALPHRPL